jgi:hypothetical protein
MSNHTLNLMASPINRDTGMKTVDTKRLAALDPDRTFAEAYKVAALNDLNKL